MIKIIRFSELHVLVPTMSTDELKITFAQNQVLVDTMRRHNYEPPVWLVESLRLAEMELNTRNRNDLLRLERALEMKLDGLKPQAQKKLEVERELAAIKAKLAQ